MSHFQAITTLFAAAFLSGCAALFEPKQTVPEPEEKTEECDRKETRGVAEFAPTDSEPNRFIFYPDEHEVVLEGHNATPGEEYKAILETPTPSGCSDLRLQLIAPVGKPD